MQELFRAAIERGASDIDIRAGDFIRARVHGDLQPLTQQKLSVEQVKGIAMKLIPHEEDRANFDKILDQEMIRIRLSETLQAVISQRLVQKKTGGRIAAMEIMPVTATIRMNMFNDPSGAAPGAGDGNMADEMSNMFGG
jgi:Tfp pilus assembly pilus retraction ATPase PilT